MAKSGSALLRKALLLLHTLQSNIVVLRANDGTPTKTQKYLCESKLDTEEHLLLTLPLGARRVTTSAEASLPGPEDQRDAHKRVLPSQADTLCLSVRGLSPSDFVRFLRGFPHRDAP